MIRLRFAVDFYGVGAIVAESDEVVADVGAGVGAAVGAEVGIGVGLDGAVNVMLGLLLLSSVTLNELVVSRRDKFTTPETCDDTVNLASPFCVVTEYGSALPFTLVFESPLLNEI